MREGEGERRIERERKRGRTREKQRERRRERKNVKCEGMQNKYQEQLQLNKENKGMTVREEKRKRK